MLYISGAKPGVRPCPDRGDDVELYYSPFAHSSPIVTFRQVDLKAKRAELSTDVRTISSIGKVPVLRAGEGRTQQDSATHILDVGFLPFRNLDS